MNSFFASLSSKKQGHNDDYTFYTYSDLLNSTNHDDYTSSTPLSLTEFYNNKTVFCTGCTGFLGKVVVEKFLRCLPNIRKLYLLVREKKDRKTGKIIPPEERLIKEILRSPIMDRIIKERFNGKREDFEVFAREKVEGVFGDVTEENIFVGSTLEKIDQLKREIQVIIHSAATIGFTERLDYAINLNAYGPLRCLNFAKQCHNIEAFTHISTAYTNANMKSGSRVDEKFYPLKLPGGEDVEAFCERIRKLSPKEIEKATTKALAFTGYPNTYTITKRIGEALVAKYKGDVNVAIVRPTIVGAALRDPVPGWIDAVSAGGSVYLFSGLGIIHLLPGNTKVVSDQVPVDFVSNAMIICPADIATRKSSLRVYHCGTSTSNPGRWQDTVTGTLRYWHTHQPDKSVSRAEFNMITNRFFYKTQYLMRYTWMIQLYGLIATIFGSKAAVKAVEGFKKMASRQSNMSSNFHHFTLNEWFFDVANLDSAFHRLPENEKDLFTLDWSLINWSTYFQYFCYGLHKYVLKENPEPPTTTDLIKSNEYNFINNLYNDVELAFTAAGRFSDGQTREQVKQTVLQSKIVQDAILSEAETLNQSVMNVQKRALQIMDQMFADPNNNAIRAFGWILRKIWRRMYQSIMVDTNEIEKLKEISKKAESGTLVFIPTHRSYIDFLIVSYVFFVYGVPVPHIAAGEDFLNMFLVRDLFRYSGAFFMKRSFGSDKLYKAIFSEYIQRLLVDGNPVEFFVEGTRSRGGKTLRPKLGLLKTIADTYLDKRVDNLTLVPIHIGYEKVIESESHTRELLGGNKKGESLSALISASSVLLRKYGDIHVKIAEPISLKDYVENMKSQAPSFDPFSQEDDKSALVKNLGTKITYDLNQSAVIMPIALVSTILLTYREGISMEELQSKTDWLKNQIISRGGNVYWLKTQSTASIVTRALGLINNIIKKNKNMLEPAIEVKSDYKKILELSYYRNQIIHLFFIESIVSCSFYSFREKLMIDQGVPLPELLKRCEFLNELLSLEFIYKEKPDDQDDFMNVINAMSKRGIFQIRDEKVFVPVLYLENLKFICSLLWPFIEAYWGASMALISLPFSGNEQEIPTLKKKALVERMQWFIEKLYFDQKVHFYEACSSETLANAVVIFDKMGILQTTVKTEKIKAKKGSANDTTKSESVVSLLPPYTEIDKLFEFVGELQQYRKTTPKTDKSALPNTEIPLRQPRL